MTSALLRWEAGVGSAGAGRQWHWRQAAGYSRVASSAAGADGEKRLRHSRVSWNDPHFLPLPARFRADVRYCQDSLYPWKQPEGSKTSSNKQLATWSGQTFTNANIIS